MICVPLHLHNISILHNTNCTYNTRIMHFNKKSAIARPAVPPPKTHHTLVSTW